jgi:DNA topoisomerase I
VRAPILAGIGRYGPYVQHQRTYANLERDDDVLAIGANRAIDLIIARETKAGGRRFGAAAPAGRSLGDHPTLGGEVLVRPGRYGPYVSHNKVNATLPKGLTIEAVTLPQAIELLAAKAGNGKGGSARGRGKAGATAKKPGGAGKTKTARSAKKSIEDADEPPFETGDPASER